MLDDDDDVSTTWAGPGRPIQAPVSAGFMASV